MKEIAEIICYMTICKRYNMLGWISLLEDPLHQINFWLIKSLICLTEIYNFKLKNTMKIVKNIKGQYSFGSNGDDESM